jgi:hypothetical protein
MSSDPEVYVSEAEYVTIDVKEMTAKRMVNWLENVADMYDMGGAEKSAEHARVIAKRISHELGENDE